MLHNKTLIIAAVLFLFGQLIIGTFILTPTDKEKLDIVIVNDLVMTITSNWESIIAGKDFIYPIMPYDYSVIKEEGSLIMNTKEGLSKSVSEAITHRDTILDIITDNKVVGKVIISNNSIEQNADQTKRLFLLFLCSAGLELILFYIYFDQINYLVFNPFEKLKLFAVRVAGGDLEMPLEMDRNNAFGAFTESFDLMREELKRSRKQEREANRSKKEVIAKLSHDIKTPVASIKAVAELMLVTAKKEKEIGQLSIIVSKADQIDGLISNLFHASLEELEELTVMPDDYNSRLLMEMIANADYRQMAFVNKIPDCILYFDKLRLQQVLDNIFGNSYKYADSSIVVNFSIDDKNMTIRIQDFGSGVLAEELPLVFEKFYRGKNGAEKSGAGLGLFISRYLMQKMGGYIACENVAEGFLVMLSIKLA